MHWQRQHYQHMQTHTHTHSQTHLLAHIFIVLAACVNMRLAPQMPTNAARHTASQSSVFLPSLSSR